MGENFKKLSAEEREKYDEINRKDKERYELEMVRLCLQHFPNQALLSFKILSYKFLLLDVTTETWQKAYKAKGAAEAKDDSDDDGSDEDPDSSDDDSSDDDSD